MSYNNLEEIKQEFKIDTSDIAEIKSRLRNLLQGIHPDKNNGTFKNDEERNRYDKIIEALEYIETPQALTLKSEVTALTKVVTELIQTSKSNDKISKYENELSKKVENSVKLYQSSHLFPKVTSSIVTAVITFIWLSPKTFAENPILSKYLSSSSPFFTVLWLISLMFTAQLWYILNRREQREQRLKSNLNLESTQNRIFHEFLRHKSKEIDKEVEKIDFTKEELIDFVVNLRVTRREIMHEEGFNERHERIRNLPFPLLTDNLVIDIELAQSLADLIIARTEKKGVAELVKSKSLIDKYRISIGGMSED